MLWRSTEKCPLALATRRAEGDKETNPRCQEWEPGSCGWRNEQQWGGRTERKGSVEGTGQAGVRQQSGMRELTEGSFLTATSVGGFSTERRASRERLKGQARRVTTKGAGLQGDHRE